MRANAKDEINQKLPSSIGWRAKSPPQFTKGKLSLYLLIGNSQMAGRVSNTDLIPPQPGDEVPHPRVMSYKGIWADGTPPVNQNEYLGAGDFLGKALTARKPNYYVGLVGVARPGSGIEEWLDDGSENEFAGLVRVIKQVNASSVAHGYGEWAGIVYMGASGETNHIEQMIDDVRRVLERPHLPFVLVPPPNANTDNFAYVASAIQATRWVDVTGLNVRWKWNEQAQTYADRDGHLDRDANVVVGERVADAFSSIERQQTLTFKRTSWQAKEIDVVKGLDEPAASFIETYTGFAYIADKNAIKIFKHRPPGPNYFIRPRFRFDTTLWQGEGVSTNSSSLRMDKPGKFGLGLSIVDGVLYRACGTLIVRQTIPTDLYPQSSGSIERPGREELTHIAVPGAIRLEGMATNGKVIYVADSDANKIFEITPNNHSNYQKRIIHPIGTNIRTLKAPLGVSALAFYKSKLFAASRRMHEIYEIDLSGKQAAVPFHLGQHFKSIDGLEILNDGAFLVSDAARGFVSVIEADRKTVRPLITIKKPGHIGLDRHRNILLIAQPEQDKIAVYKMAWNYAPSLFSGDARLAEEPATKPLRFETLEEKLKKKKVMAEVEAIVKRTSRALTLKQIAPYKTALTTTEYEVRRVVKGVLKARSIIVVEMAMQNAQILPAANLKAGEVRKLRLCLWSDLQGVLDYPIADEIHDFDATYFYGLPANPTFNKDKR
jgi:hypothetical protein